MDLELKWLRASTLVSEVLGLIPPSLNIACINKLFSSLALLQLFVSAQSQSYKEKLIGSSFLFGDQRKNVDHVLKIYNYEWLSNAWKSAW